MALTDYPYSSYGDIIGIRHSKWVKQKELLSFFGRTDSILAEKCHTYVDFVLMIEDITSGDTENFIDYNDPN